MNYRTFVVCLLLALPVQLGKLSKTDSLGFIEVSIAFLGACGIALFWAYIATWLRNRFAKDLSGSYITKVQIGFAAIGIVLLISVIVNHSEVDTSNGKSKAPSMIEEASLRADAELHLIKACKNSPKNDQIRCEDIGNVLSKCISELKKPRNQIAESIEICVNQIEPQ